MRREQIPRLPVFGWQSLTGQRTATVDCMLDLPGLHFSTSGRASILLALEALGVRTGDQVLLPTYHCPTMVAPTAFLGAVPFFYPIDSHGAPDLGWLEAQDLSKVRVMLVAHYFGLPQALGPISRWCQRRGIALIEDCAHALFGRSGERQIGAWGDISIGSLTKYLPLPEGGCLVINNGRLAVRELEPSPTVAHLKALLDVLEVGASQRRLRGLNHLIAGGLVLLRGLRGRKARIARADSKQAASADVTAGDFSINADLAHRRLALPCRWVANTLPRARIVHLRRQHYEFLRTQLSDQAGLHPLLPVLPADCAPYVFPLWVDAPDPGYAELRRLGMPVFRWDRLWTDVPSIVGDSGLHWSHHVLQLACHQDLTAAELNRFVEALLRLYAKPGPMQINKTAVAPSSRIPA